MIKIRLFELIEFSEQFPLLLLQFLLVSPVPYALLPQKFVELGDRVLEFLDVSSPLVRIFEPFKIPIKLGFQIFSVLLEDPLTFF